MIDIADAAALVRAFDVPNDGEALKSRDLALMLLASVVHPFSRKLFAPGHITATGLVLSPFPSRLLLVHHRRLDRWLPPGGHVEPEDDSLGDAARREVLEETGVSVAPGAPRLAGIDVHGIPARGSEPYHLHHDLLFLFHATTTDLQVSPESRDVIWCPPDQFDRYDVPPNVRRAFARVLSTD